MNGMVITRKILEPHLQPSRRALFGSRTNPSKSIRDVLDQKLQLKEPRRALKGELVLMNLLWMKLWNASLSAKSKQEFVNSRANQFQ